jgi:hypothetical protein
MFTRQVESSMMKAAGMRARGRAVSARDPVLDVAPVATADLVLRTAVESRIMSVAAASPRRQWLPAGIVDVKQTFAEFLM